MSEKITSSKQPHNQDSAPAKTFSEELLELAELETNSVLKRLETQLTGLSEADAALRLQQYGLNELAKEKPQSVLMHLINNLKNPLVILLVSLAVLSYLTGDLRATVVISVMIVLGIVLRFFQEMRADNAAAALKAMVVNKATVVRDGKEQEISLKLLVPGDIITIAAGDMIPADVRIISAKDLFLDQAALTGEAMPIEKKSIAASKDMDNPLEIANLCFLGSNVVSGTGDGGSCPYRRKDLFWGTFNQPCGAARINKF